MSGHASKVAQFRQSQNLDHHILTFGTPLIYFLTHLDSIEFVSIDYNFPFYRFDGVWCVIQILRLKNRLNVSQHNSLNFWTQIHKYLILGTQTNKKIPLSRHRRLANMEVWKVGITTWDACYTSGNLGGHPRIWQNSRKPLEGD